MMKYFPNRQLHPNQHNLFILISYFILMTVIISLVIIVSVIMCLCYVLNNSENFTTSSASTTASISESDEKFSELYNLIQSQKYKVDILRDALVPIETTSSS